MHGYTDMVTPYAVSRYVLDHLPDFAEPARAQLKVYRGGHMFYIDDAVAPRASPPPPDRSTQPSLVRTSLNALTAAAPRPSPALRQGDAG